MNAISSTGGRLEPDPVVHCIAQALAACDITFGRLNAHVPEQELDLLQFAAGLVAQPSARAAQIVRAQLRLGRTPHRRL